MGLIFKVFLIDWIICTIWFVKGCVIKIIEFVIWIFEFYMIEFDLIIEFYRVKEVSKVDLYVIFLLVFHFIWVKLTIMFRLYKVKEGGFNSS